MPASFINWPHASPSAEDLADVGFSHKPTIKETDNVICQICKTQLCDWQPEDNPRSEHYNRSRNCLRVASKTEVSPPEDTQASLQKDLQISSQPGNQKAPQGNQPVKKEAPQATAQQAKVQRYHKCTICMASFSSISRLLSHSQSSCGQPSYKHCDEVFESKNQLHKHIREECSMTKSNGPHHSAVERQAPRNIGLLQLTAPEKDIAKQSVTTVATASTPALITTESTSNRTSPKTIPAPESTSAHAPIIAITSRLTSRPSTHSDIRS